MSLFDLLFLFATFATIVTLLVIAAAALSGHGVNKPVLRILAIAWASYFAVVVLSSLLLHRRVFYPGDDVCFDDWCMTVENGVRTIAGANAIYRVDLRLSSRARRVWQRENDLAVYLVDDRAARYRPNPARSVTPFNVLLGPSERVQATRVFEVPANRSVRGLEIHHEGGFPIGWFIIGYDAWFRKPALMEVAFRGEESPPMQ